MDPQLKLVPLYKRGEKHYQNKHYFRDRKVMLYQRADVQSDIWYVRLRVQGRYKIISLKTGDFAKAKTVALDTFDELRYKDKFGMPVFEKKFVEVVDEFLEHSEGRIKLGEITTHWMSTAKSIMNAWKKYLGNSDITNIPQKKVDGYPLWRMKNNRSGENIAMETIVTELSYFRQCIYWARDKKYVTEYQLPNVHVPKISKRNRRKRDAFTLDEYRVLYRFMRTWVREPKKPEKAYERQELRHFIIFLANTGLRPGGETKDLRWKDIEYRDDGHIYIWVAVSKTKADECVAQPRLKTTLERWRSMSKHTKPDDLVFPGIHDNRGVRNRFKSMFNSLMDASGLRVGRSGTNRTLYSMRHTYITFALRYGHVDAFWIADNCRTSVKQLENHYAHVRKPEYADRVTARGKNK